MGISTPLKKLIGWPARSATALAKTIKKSYKGLKEIKPKLKQDTTNRALDTKESVLRARRKTIALFRRPLNDISHIGILMVISIALLSGISAMLGTNEQIAVNPFVSKVSAAKYVSDNDKRIIQADSVTTVAYYIDRVKLGPDAAEVTEKLNVHLASNNGISGGYLASVPIIQSSSEQTGQKVTEYIVQGGDTLSTIAVKFNVSTDTIRYANSIADVDSLSPGDKLIIPPVTGVLHTVAAGETTASIAKRYSASEAMIISQNDLYGMDLVVGMKIMVPDGDIPEAPKPVQTQVASAPVSRSGSLGSSQRIAASGMFIFPTVNAQGYYNGYHNWAIDIPGAIGTPIYAADSGRVVEAQYGWNGGYGNTILIDHGNGYTTRYAHMTELAVIGGYVSKGQVIGYMGSTGRSTGSHLHFEILIGGVRQNPINYF